jgi:hypothetical protein
MAASLNESDKSYLFFKEGLAVGIPPKVRAQGQVIRNFGMLPPAYWQEAQMNTFKPKKNNRQMSTPGPMKGGAPMYLGNQFTHGLMW